MRIWISLAEKEQAIIDFLGDGVVATGMQIARGADSHLHRGNVYHIIGSMRKRGLLDTKMYETNRVFYGLSGAFGK